jgi:hypothetical protein
MDSCARLTTPHILIALVCLHQVASEKINLAWVCPPPAAEDSNVCPDLPRFMGFGISAVTAVLRQTRAKKTKTAAIASDALK